ncbi:MAG TPA: hypothetical protein VGU26_05625 [Gaiellaceae bacterium]|jgi:hypothetical protein|nr:hypothetical protein [Gaiellaceae bacterium]
MWRRKEEEMAVAVLVEIPHGTEAQYEQVASEIFADGKLPPGWLLHMAGPEDDRWRVVNIVESRDEFERFARETIMPATQKAGEEPPQFTFVPLHTLIGA